MGSLFSLTKEKRISGAELLHAFVLGVEAECRIGDAVSPGHYEKGWHITSTCGVFGAAAGAGKVLGLDEKQVLSAFGLAATQAAGLVESLGSMAKSLSVGVAARNGLFAALLAAKGFSGPEQPIEGRYGFAKVFGGNDELAGLSARLGEHWALSQVAYKPYPCAVVLHPAIDGCLELREAHAIPPEAIDTIVLTVHPLALERADRPQPATGLESKLSAHHAAAVALVQGAAGIEQFSDAAAADPEIARLRDKVKLRPDSSLRRNEAYVALQTVDIRGASVHVEHARGSLERPMSDAELETKFRQLAGPRAEELIHLVRSLESLDDARRLAEGTGSP